MPNSAPTLPDAPTAAVVSLRDHLAALRESDLRFEAERDRRYTEVAEARAEALRIKEDADRRALELARTIQEYRDEQANDLRKQIGSERGLYPTKDELTSAIDKLGETIKPLVAYVAASQGRSGGIVSGREWVGWIAGLISIGIAVYFALNK